MWGDGGLSVAQSGRSSRRDVTELYERDYITAWDDILNDLEIVPFSTVPQTTEALGILVGPTSPLRGTAEERSSRTRPSSTAPDTAPASGALASAGKKVTEGLGKTPEAGAERPWASPSVAPGHARSRLHFQPIHRLMAGAPAARRSTAFSSRSARFSSSSDARSAGGRQRSARGAVESRAARAPAGAAAGCGDPAAAGQHA